MFDYKVSSEASWDWPEFRLNSLLLQRWSGESGWATYQFSVAAGTNVFQWRYTKDPIGSSGVDIAFIDNLDSPQMTTTLRLLNSRHHGRNRCGFKVPLTWVPGRTSRQLF